MLFNRLGVEQETKPVTLPRIHLTDIDTAAEAKEAAARIAERKIIRIGRDAWQELGRVNSFDSWTKIGAALAVGRIFALRSTGANRPEGRPYCEVFSKWIVEHGFASMQKSVRSTCLELHEHTSQITAWRDSLPEGQRRRLIHPLSVTRRWKASLAHGNGKCPQDLKREATAAWRRFVALWKRCQRIRPRHCGGRYMSRPLRLSFRPSFSALVFFAFQLFPLPSTHPTCEPVPRGRCPRPPRSRSSQEWNSASASPRTVWP